MNVSRCVLSSNFVVCALPKRSFFKNLLKTIAASTPEGVRKSKLRRKYPGEDPYGGKLSQRFVRMIFQPMWLERISYSNTAMGNRALIYWGIFLIVGPALVYNAYHFFTLTPEQYELWLKVRERIHSRARYLNEQQVPGTNLAGPFRYRPPNQRFDDESTIEDRQAHVMDRIVEAEKFLFGRNIQTPVPQKDRGLEKYDEETKDMIRKARLSKLF